ncbi:MAG TPA: Flp1 family type IVb pilin [Bacillota bacterium]|nr:Flp1 family type IVb pilin [Bacillota bacterium]
MGELLKAFWRDEEGLETLEMVIILVILVSLAFLFKGKLNSWFTMLTTKTDAKIMQF